MKIITVTLNPSLDRVLLTHYLNIGYHNLTSGPTRLDPAGRGVNVARALHRLNCPAHAVILLGKDATGRAYRALVAEEGFPVTFIDREGQTRSNITVLDTGNGQETRFIDECEDGSAQDIQAVTETLRDMIEPGDLVVLAGSLPGAAPPDTYAALTDEAHHAGAVVILAARRAEAIQHGLKSEPDVVVLGHIEVERLFNFPVRTKEDAIYCARELQSRGVQQVLMTMLGGDVATPAAILVTDENVWVIDTPEFGPGTQDGINDALLSGYLTAWSKSYPSKKALELGTAAAIYTASQVGSEFGTLAQVEKHLKEAIVLGSKVE